jgi:hypothetical protein
MTSFGSSFVLTAQELTVMSPRFTGTKVVEPMRQGRKGLAINTNNSPAR